MTKKEGTISFWVKGRVSHWYLDAEGYTFEPIEMDGLHVSVTKHPDHTLEVVSKGIAPVPIVFRHTIPRCVEKGVNVAITWTPTEIKFYMNGDPIETWFLEPAPEIDA